MQLVEVEHRTLESRAVEGGVSLLEADGLQRQSPLARDTFDNLLFCATRFAFSEGSWDTFHTGMLTYLGLTRHSPGYAPPLVPPEVYADARDVLGDYRLDRGPDESLADDCFMLTQHNKHVGERLLLKLAGNLEDDLGAAGKRAFSHMMAGRIADGIVHPAVGGHLWGKYMAVTTGPSTGGPHVTVMRRIGDLSKAWVTDPTDRPRIERVILNEAYRHGWTANLTTDELR